MIPNVEIRLQYSMFSNNVELVIIRESEAGRFEYGQLVFNEVKENHIPSPSCVLNIHNANKLFNNLLQQGFKADSEGTAKGELSATKKHLEDMRSISFKYLNLLKDG